MRQSASAGHVPHFGEELPKWSQVASTLRWVHWAMGLTSLSSGRWPSGGLGSGCTGPPHVAMCVVPVRAGIQPPPVGLALCFGYGAVSAHSKEPGLLSSPPAWGALPHTLRWRWCLLLICTCAQCAHGDLGAPVGAERPFGKPVNFSVPFAPSSCKSFPWPRGVARPLALALTVGSSGSPPRREKPHFAHFFQHQL